MQLDQIRLQLRRRTEWEALELGRAMLREWSGPVYRVWCSTFVPFAAAVTVALWTRPDISVIVIWWSKPVFDRVLLHVYSQCAFGVEPTVRDVYRTLPSILGRSGLLAWLTVYRLGPSRSFVLPIWQLERQRGRAARSRSRLLKRRAGSYAAWLTVTCAAMGATLYVSQVLVFEVLVPIGQQGLFTWPQWASGTLGHTALILLSVFAALAASVTEPLYIASGFSLYLNRRAELEAWDVELRFRSLAQRRSRDTTKASAVRAVAVAVVLLVLATSTAHAQRAMPGGNALPEANATAAESSPTKRVVLDVLRDPVFGIERDVTEWRPRSAPETDAGPQLPEWLRWIPTVVAWMATVGRYLVGIAAGVGLAWFLVRLQARRTVSVPPSAEAAPDALFGLDVRPESLPIDLAAHARQLALAGDVTAALALLYRGALVALVHGEGVQLRVGDTERDCLRRAGDVLPGVEFDYFRTLVSSWQHAAYAQTAPQPEAVLGLCDRWPPAFAIAEAPR